MRIFHWMVSFSLFLPWGLYAVKAESVEATKEPAIEERGKELEPAFSQFDAIQPRNEGAKWVYKSVYFENGRAVSSGSSREEIVETIELDGVACFHVRVTMDWRSLLQRLAGTKLDEEDFYYFWDYSNERGSFHFDPETKEQKRPGKLSDFDLNLRFPVEKGTKYVIDETHYEVLDTSRPLKVPVGRFECVVYEMTYPEVEEEEFRSRERYFMAKGVGMVVVEGDIWEDGEWVLDYRDELISYDLKIGAKVEKKPESDAKPAGTKEKP